MCISCSVNRSEWTYQIHILLSDAMQDVSEDSRISPPILEPVLKSWGK